MRDFVAWLVALALLFVALSLSTTLHFARRQRLRQRRAELDAGRAIIAEIPGEDDLILFTEDAAAFHYGDRPIPKAAIAAVRVLINGSPIAACVSRQHPEAAARQATAFEDHPEGIARDRWDVAIETTTGTTLVECGAIRERVSQELARAVFDAVRRDIERREA
jgi:translation elongation factor EF-4